MDISYKQNKFKNLISDSKNLSLQLSFINLLNHINSLDVEYIRAFKSELQNLQETLDYNMLNGILDLLDAAILQYYKECPNKDNFKNQLSNLYIELFADYTETLPWIVYWDILTIRYCIKYGLIGEPLFRDMLYTIIADYNKCIDSIAPIYRHYFSKFILELYLLIYLDYNDLYKDWINVVDITSISNKTKEFLTNDVYEIKFFILERNTDNER